MLSSPAIHALRRESRAETASMRKELAELAVEVRELRERIASMKTASNPGTRPAVLSDDERAVRRETDR